MDFRLAIQTDNDVAGRKRSILILVAGAAVAAVAVFIVIFVFNIANSQNHANPEYIYTIYYGHLIDGNGNLTEQTKEILAAKPRLVIVPYSFPDGELNLTPNVDSRFKEAGIKVFTYTWTRYTERDLEDVFAEIDRQMASGVDGIFVDEVTNIENDSQYNYYSAIYHHVKQFGADKQVIMNPGHYKVSEKIMSISDIVSLEAEWTLSDLITWKEKYPPARFMGVSSNEYIGLNQSATQGEGIYDSRRAAEETAKAWSSGIGYHFSTDRYIDIPPWFAEYFRIANNERNSKG